MKMTNNTGVSVLLASMFPNCVTALNNNQNKDQVENVTKPGTENSDNGAVIYIVAVLMFYSFGVVVMIVQYLRTEKKELEEEVNLETFFKGMPDKRLEREHNVNKVAIRAFHTLTSISYEDSDDDTSPRTVLVTDL